MQASVDPVNPAVGEADEEWVLQPIIPTKRSFIGKVVEFGPSANLCKEKWCCENGHDGHRRQALFDLLLHLVWEVSGVLKEALVVYRVVHNEAAEKVHGQTEEPIKQTYCKSMNNSNSQLILTKSSKTAITSASPCYLASTSWLPPN